MPGIVVVDCLSGAREGAQDMQALVTRFLEVRNQSAGVARISGLCPPEGPPSTALGW